MHAAIRPPRRSASVFALLLACALALPAGGAGSEDDAARAERLALAVYHEGFPPEYGPLIGPQGAARLAALLADPAHARHHATLIEALGHSGQPGAFEALAAYAAGAGPEEIPRHALAARRAVPVAMGQLARSDDRALAWLLDAAADAGPAPFRAGRDDAAEVGARLRRMALLGLALSGRAEALAALRAAAAEPDARLARDAGVALEHAAASGAAQ